MKTLLHANRAEPKSISVISILLLAAVGYITKLLCMHRECYIFASQNLCLYCTLYCYVLSIITLGILIYIIVTNTNNKLYINYIYGAYRKQAYFFL